MNKQQLIEELAKKIYDGVWFESDPNPGMDNWKCCINEATIAVEFMEKRYAPLVEEIEYIIGNWICDRENPDDVREELCGRDNLCRRCMLHKALKTLKGG